MTIIHIAWLGERKCHCEPGFSPTADLIYRGIAFVGLVCGLLIAGVLVAMALGLEAVR